MQDPSPFTQLRNALPRLSFPEQEQLKCPRCDSTNTKFCYYNNYNLSQPRHFCKSCRRYWTKGGALRNIPVGGGTRKNAKRSSSSSKRPAQKPNPDPDLKPKADQNLVLGAEPIDLDHMGGGGGGGGGSLNSLLAPSMNVQFGSFPHRSGPLNGSSFGSSHGKLNPGSSSGVARKQGPGLQEIGGSNGFLGGMRNGWPDLAIYNYTSPSPASRFQLN